MNIQETTRCDEEVLKPELLMKTTDFMAEIVIYLNLVLRCFIFLEDSSNTQKSPDKRVPSVS